jgi:hypothetical protein
MATDAYAVAIARIAEHITSDGERTVTAERIAEAMFPFEPEPELIEDVRRRLIKAVDAMINDGYQAYPLKAICFAEDVEAPKTSKDAKEWLATAKDVAGVGRAAGEDDVLWEAMRDRLLGPVASAIRSIRKLEGYAVRGLLDELDIQAAAAKAHLEIETSSNYGQIIFPQLNAGNGESA